MTKTKQILSFTFALALLLAACAPGQSDNGQPEQEQPKATDAQPTAEPTAVPTETPAAGACYHPYYPVVVGATHTYSSTSADLGAYTFTDTITNVRADGFTLTTEFEGLTRVQEWECSAEGLASLEYDSGVAAAITTSGMNASFETTGSTGVTLPADVAPGDTWEQSFDVTGTMVMAEAGNAEASGTVDISFEAIGVEEVTTAAGTFMALRVESDLTFDLSVTFEGFEIPVSLQGHTISWYAEGVGWVKSEDTATFAEAGTFSSVVDMQSYNIP